ncbi:unnamed protein product [Ambrosiozyma monospora]|uniref:Unnamed protein product n=1 Tax=Ambrosiozyma monospora TaxID=43982 RepID=A0ACB5SX92_AMBMO|nr:unnamed protein product [Ambrosiozyma monospora]
MTPQWLRRNIRGWLKQARELDSQSDAAYKSRDPSKYTENIFKQSLRVLLEYTTRNINSMSNPDHSSLHLILGGTLVHQKTSSFNFVYPGFEENDY